ncbi:MAG: M28 family peptidase [Clostridia bacterium]|nr:M28 family peptidase [Clostridia bacterium]
MTKEQKEMSAPHMPGKFKGVYYSILAIVAVVILVISFVTYYYAPASTSTSVDVSVANANAVTLAQSERNEYNGNNGTSVTASVNKIKNWLNEAGINEVKSTKLNDSATMTSKDQKFTTQSVTSASYTVQDFEALEYVIDSDTVTDMTGGDYVGQEGVIYATSYVKNVIVTIPGKGDDAVLFMTHYDSNNGSKNATSASAVAAMIATIDELADGSYENDLVFVITCGRYEGSVGAYAFKNQFVGFDNVYSRVKVAFNFDAITAGGALTIVQSSEGDSDVMSGYLASSASVRSDSSVTALMEEKFSSDFDIFYNKVNEEWDIPALNIMTTGGAYDAGTSYDSEVGESVTAQYASAMEGLANHFGNADLNIGSGVESASVTYFGASIGMHGIAVYIIVALLLVLLVGNFWLGAKKKAFSANSVVKGAVGVILALGLSLGAFFLAYFAVGMLTVAFGAVSMNMLTSAHLLTPAVLIPAILFAMAVQCGLYPAIKKGLKVKAGDVVRGGAVVQMITAIAFGFIFPAGSLAYVLVGIANGVVMLVSTLARSAFRNKFGFGIERLMLYTVPAILGLPMLIQATMMVGNLVATVTMPFMLVAIALLLTSVTPYFDYLQPVLSDAVYKLPKHTIRVVETVVEEKEDEIKKGKFETVTETRVVNRKVAWNYRNWFGVTFLCVITMIALIVATPISANVNANVSNNFISTYDYTKTDITDSLYDDAIVCYVDASYSNPGKFYWLVKDEAVYQTLKKVEGYDYYEWSYDDRLEAYKMSVSTDNMPTYMETGLFTKDTESEEGYVKINVNTIANKASQVKMTLDGIKVSDELTVIKDDETIYSITFDQPAEDIEFALPYGLGNCEIKIKTDSTTVSVEGYEYINNPLVLNYAGEQYNEIVAELAEKGINLDLNVAYIIKDTI